MRMLPPYGSINFHYSSYSSHHQKYRPPPSARWIHILSRSDEKRTARFVCCVAAAFPDRKTEVVRGTIEGRIGYKEEGKNGFGYDPIFYVPEYGCTTASMSSETKNAISHRGKALQLIKPVIGAYLETKGI